MKGAQKTWLAIDLFCFFCMGNISTHSWSVLYVALPSLYVALPKGIFLFLLLVVQTSSDISSWGFKEPPYSNSVLHVSCISMQISTGQLEFWTINSMSGILLFLAWSWKWKMAACLKGKDPIGGTHSWKLSHVYRRKGIVTYQSVDFLFCCHFQMYLPWFYTRIRTTAIFGRVPKIRDT